MPGATRGNGSLKPIQWNKDDWVWLAEIAKSVGMSRSAFVREAAVTAAKATASGLVPYFVEGAKASQQNTRINHSDQTIAKQGGGRSGGCGERTRKEPKASAGRKSGGFVAGATNGTKQKAPKG